MLGLFVAIAARMIKPCDCNVKISVIYADDKEDIKEKPEIKDEEKKEDVKEEKKKIKGQSRFLEIWQKMNKNKNQR